MPVHPSVPMEEKRMCWGMRFRQRRIEVRQFPDSATAGASAPRGGGWQEVRLLGLEELIAPEAFRRLYKDNWTNLFGDPLHEGTAPEADFYLVHYVTVVSSVIMLPGGFLWFVF